MNRTLPIRSRYGWLAAAFTLLLLLASEPAMRSVWLGTLAWTFLAYSLPLTFYLFCLSVMALKGEKSLPPAARRPLSEAFPTLGAHLATGPDSNAGSLSEPDPVTPSGRTPPVNTPTRFAVVVPAHNEEAVISGTLQSLAGLDYPGSCWQAVVVADNCDDATAEIARAAGALVLQRDNPHLRGKGFALRWAFERLLGGDRFDAVLVVDADSVITSNALKALHRGIRRGAAVLQLDDQIQPRPGAWNSEVTRLGFFLTNYIRPMGRLRLGLPVGLKGNGMCFTAPVLREVPWNAFSLAEDLEFGLELLRRGHPPRFVPEAAVLALTPTHPDLARSQRRRWEMGRWPVVARHLPALLFTRTVRPAWHRWDALAELSTPPLVNFAMLHGVAVPLAGLGWWLNTPWIGMALPAWTLSLALLAGHVGLAMRSSRADDSLRNVLRSVPRYAAWKLGVYGQTLFKGMENRWVRTSRD
jgi:1,2-diacylglycerol 3-beta-glucosyltransferase